MSSEEKDPTCVVKMLESLRPAHDRKSGVGRSTMNARRGSAVATRLQFDSSLTIERSSVFTKRRVMDLDATKSPGDKRIKLESGGTPSVAPVPGRPTYDHSASLDITSVYVG